MESTMIRRFLPFAAFMAAFLCLSSTEARNTDLLKGDVMSTTARSSSITISINGRDTRTWVVKASTTASTGSVTYTVDGSMDGINWVPIIQPNTLSLSTTVTTDAFTDESVFYFYSLKVTAISGTGASAQLMLGQ
jgi:hypothetical protein